MKKPETFEAHGHTWTKHTPGDPMPCDGEALVITICRRELKDREKPYKNGYPAKQFLWHERPSFGGALELIGWRYASPAAPPVEEKDEPTKHMSLIPKPQKEDWSLAMLRQVNSSQAASLERLLEEKSAMLEAIKPVAQTLAFYASCWDNGAWHLVSGKDAESALSKLNPFLP